MRKSLVWIIVVAAIASTQQLVASSMLLDRGLPTANLNNASGANRSNVAWAFGGYTSADYWLVGDTITNSSSLTWSIDTIRLWTVGRTEMAVLRGSAGDSSTGVISDATYANPAPNDNYQGSSGSYILMHQVDFSVNIVLAPGKSYDFFLDGRGAAEGIVVPFAHASNAALSGSPQDGADDSMLYAHVVDGVLDVSSIGTWSSKGDGWDKASDINVQVFGTVPDTSATLMLLSIGFAGLAAFRRRLHA